jgi:UDP-3-O-[3-hydroxymyristoyl] glucosamine N-acyltransferase
VLVGKVGTGVGTGVALGRGVPVGSGVCVGRDVAVGKPPIRSYQNRTLAEKRFS